jgi:hypothetical protein
VTDEAPSKSLLRLVSHFPGRLRVRAEVFRVLPEVAEGVQKSLSEENGVLSVSASKTTGSMLIAYDPQELQLPRLVALLVRAGGLHGLEVDAASEAAHLDGPRVRAAFGRFNDLVKGASRGKVDLKVAVPGTLAAAGFARLVFGNRRVPEWYDLLFWSFVIFSGLNPAAQQAASGNGERTAH